jgi:hypothetical protein
LVIAADLSAIVRAEGDHEHRRKSAGNGPLGGSGFRPLPLEPLYANGSLDRDADGRYVLKTK